MKDWEVKKAQIQGRIYGTNPEADILKKVNETCEGGWEPFALFKDSESDEHYDYELWLKKPKYFKPSDCEHL